MRISAFRPRLVVVAALFLPVLIAGACATTSEADGKVTVVGPRAAVALIEQGDHVVVDLRPEAAYEAARVAGAVNLPFADTEFAARVAELDHDAAYLVYAQDPADAARAADVMVAEGIPDVVDGGAFGLLALAGAELDGASPD